jgi:hypothetical protein
MALVVGGLPTQMRRVWSASKLFETSISAIQGEIFGAEAKSQIAATRWKNHSPFQEPDQEAEHETATQMRNLDQTDQ